MIKKVFLVVAVFIACIACFAGGVETGKRHVPKVKSTEEINTMSTDELCEYARSVSPAFNEGFSVGVNYIHALLYPDKKSK